MGDKDKVIESLSRDWSDARVDTSEPSGSVVHSTRMSRETTARLFAEAERRGVTPSALIRDLVERGLASSDDNDVVVLAKWEVRQFFDQHTRPRAANPRDQLRGRFEDDPEDRIANSG